MKKTITLCLLAVSAFFAAPQAEAYTQKAPYAGYGQASKVNGMPKTKAVSGYTKQTSKGTVYVNPYYRSKM